LEEGVGRHFEGKRCVCFAARILNRVRASIIALQRNDSIAAAIDYDH
jgi:hypothetical protein